MADRTGGLPAGVAAGHPDTARVGREVLRQGGSAADAVAAMILAGCVAETIFTGLGGGGFATVYEADTGAVHCLDFFVAVPGLDGTVAKAPTVIEVAFGGVAAVPYAMGGPTVAVPGTPAGVAELHRRWGVLPWPEIVTPARDLAARGVSFSAAHADLLPDVAPAMVAGAGAQIYQTISPDGLTQLLVADELLYHKGLADTFDEYLRQGSDAFYTGSWARAFAAAVRADGGALSTDDLAAYEVVELAPTRVRFGPGEIRVRGNDLDAFAATAAALDPVALGAGPAARTRALVAALRAVTKRAETTSVVAVDAAGNACAATHSLGLGSGVWVDGVHGNSMLGEGELLRGELVPGGRMPSMMVPLMVTDSRDRLLLAGGAAGGSRIRPALLQVLIGVLLDGRSTVDAVAAPRVSATPDIVHLEPGFPAEVAAALLADGEQVLIWNEIKPYFGGVAVAAADGPAADPRRGGLALLA